MDVLNDIFFLWRNEKMVVGIVFLVFILLLNVFIIVLVFKLLFLLSSFFIFLNFLIYIGCEGVVLWLLKYIKNNISGLFIG